MMQGKEGMMHKDGRDVGKGGDDAQGGRDAGKGVMHNECHDAGNDES